MAYCFASNAPLYAYTNRGTMPLSELTGHGNAIDLLRTSVDAEAEHGLSVVRIPINRGLSGFRVFIIQKYGQADFDSAQSLAALRALTVAFRIS
jgi:hypothetical protein